ncbi:MAG TPA: hypothetical protein VES58_00895 [Syntrophobacteria bacterium]|nr:hypothetical protein [Syntrophobacteria bacterium]
MIALESGEALRISWDDFSRLVAQDLRIGYQFWRNMALLSTKRLRDTTMFCSKLLGMR